MNPIDDLFRDGLGARKAEVPDNLWDKIKAQKPTLPAEGEALDYYFKDKLAGRVAPVPAGMWQRIVAARGRKALAWRRALAVAATVLLLVIGYLALTPDLSETPAPLAERSPAEWNNSQVSTTPEETALTPATTITEAGFAPGSSAALAEPAELTTPTHTESPRAVGSTSDKILQDRDDSAGAPQASIPRPAQTARAEIYQVAELPALPQGQLAVPALLPTPKRHYRAKARPGGAFKSAPRHRSQTELLFGVSYSNQQFSLNGSSVNNLLRDAREVSEFPKAGYQITLRQSYRLGERLRFIGGLTYASIRNRFEYERVVNGTSELNRVSNQIRLLEAPLLLGYALPGKGRLQVSLNAGPVVNLISAANGQFLDPNAPTPLQLEEDGQYRSNIGLGLMTSLTTTYLIGKEDPFLLVVEPFFKGYLESFTVKDAPLREQYWVAGMQLGVRKAF
ncbi:MAG: outer membrane beta-barrel protein [Bacteroidota bacterium]